MALFLAGTRFWQLDYRYVIVTVVVSMGKTCQKSLWFCDFSGDDMQRTAPIMFLGDFIALVLMFRSRPNHFQPL